MRLANEIAARAMEHVRGAAAARDDRERRRRRCGRAGCTAHGTGFNGQVELARGFSLVWSGAGDPHLHGHRQPSDPGARADPVRDLGLRRRLLVRPHEEPRPRRARRSAMPSSSSSCSASTRAAVDFCRPGASLAELDRMIRDGLAELGYPGQPSHPVCHGVGARAHEPPYAHQAGGGTIEAGMVLAIEPGVYWPEGGGLRVEDNFLITESGAGAALPLPRRDRAGYDDRSRQGLDGRAEPARARAADARHGRPLRHDSARRRADRRRRPLAGGQARDRPSAGRGGRRPDRGRLRARLGGGRRGDPADRGRRSRRRGLGLRSRRAGRRRAARRASA